MTRKDSEKDVDRPHYYSQFWLDIAAGRRVIGGPRPEDEAGEAELPEPTPIPVRKNGRNSTADGYKETRTVATTALVVDEEEDEDVIEPPEEDLQQEDAIDEDEIPNILLDEASPKAQASAEGEDEATEEEQDDEEEQDEEEWGSRGGRKKAKPVRPVKKPKPRRSF